MKSRLLIIALLTSFSSFGQTDGCFKNLKSLTLLTETISTYRPNNWDDAYTQMEVYDVYNKRFNYADSILNVVYQELHSTLDCLIQSDTFFEESYYSEMKSTIITGQKAWVITRDADASFYYSTAFGGWINNQWYLNELTHSTRIRTEKLLDMITSLQEAHSR